ncbi:MAG TPA: LuxR family transcriptional regulator [Rhodobacteraceae bacterium]|jgi:LuxR family transcriptional regulator|nr:LuxR family transcriptional regulator [Paracoccaceae bacterium]
MTRALDYLDQMLQTQSVEEVWENHCRMMESFGFDRLIYGFTRYRTPNSLGDPEDFIVLTNHSKAYTDVYMGQGLYLNAPMTKWALANEGASSWRVWTDLLRSGDASETTRKVMNFNVSMQVVAGYTISFKSRSERIKCAIALTAKPGLTQDDADRIWATHGQELMVMNTVLHLKIQSLPYFTPHRSLTKRQRETLQWVGDGKTMQDIAILMGLTPATVEKHLRLAREALNVETTAQAVLKAAFQNQMFIMEV